MRKNIILNLKKSRILLGLFVILIFCMGMMWDKPKRSIKFLLPVPPNQYITSINMDDLQKQIIPEYGIKYLEDLSIWGRRLRFSNPTTQSDWVEITVAVYTSLDQVLESASYYLSDISAILSYGTKSGKSIGNISLYSPSGISKGLLFIRNNVLVDISSKSQEESERIAAEIDRLLLKGGKGVTLSNDPPKPLYRSIDVPSEIKTGKQVPIIVHPFDTKGKEIKFGMYNKNWNENPISRGNNNERIYKANKAGNDSFLIWVYNDDNVFSFEEKEIKVIP